MTTDDSSAAVTAVVVAYNHSAFVSQALDSVAGQSYPPSRIIVADDASTDDTTEVIARWIASHPELEVEILLHDVNVGLCRTLNEILERVDTPLYAYISADDRMREDRFEKQVRRWQASGSSAALVYSNASRIDADGDLLTPDYATISNWESVPSLEGDVHTALLAHNWLPAASVLLSTQDVRRAGGYDERWFYEDHDLWLRLAARGGGFLCVDEPLVEVRELATSLGSTHFGAARPAHLAARLGILLDQRGVSAEGDLYIDEVAPHLAVALWRTGERPDVVRRALRLPGLQRHPRWLLRRLLLGLGATREPRLASRLRRLVAHASRHLT